MVLVLKDFLDAARKKASELTNKVVESDFGKEINAKKIVDTTKSVASRAASKIKGVASSAKEKGYTVAGTLERQYNEDKSIGGAAKGVIKKGKILCKGVKFAAKPLTKKVEQYAQQIQQHNEEFIETFTTDGKYDPEKTSDAIKNKAAIVDKWGIDVFNWLVDMSKKGVSALREDYRKDAPSLDELKGKYAGFGVKQKKGFLSRQHLENSLEFHNQTFAALGQYASENSGLILNILDDIKSYATRDKSELLKHYLPNGKAQSDEAQTKANFVLNYLVICD